MAVTRYTMLFDLRDRVFRSGKWRHLDIDVSPWWVTWLGGDAMKFPDEVYPTRNMLAELRVRAKRCRVWFNHLSGNQRRLIELVTRVVKEKVRSLDLAKLIAPIAKKLVDAMGGIQALVGEITYKARTVGFSLAQKLSLIAQAWGNKSAAEWSKDRGFMQYLAILDKHRP